MSVTACVVVLLVDMPPMRIAQRSTCEWAWSSLNLNTSWTSAMWNENEWWGFFLEGIACQPSFDSVCERGRERVSVLWCSWFRWCFEGIGGMACQSSFAKIWLCVCVHCTLVQLIQMVLWRDRTVIWNTQFGRPQAGPVSGVCGLNVLHAIDA